jgi:predicted AAA+ superfamily ATPase
LEFVQNYSLSQPVPQSIHDELMRFVKDFCVVGGMPEAVDTFSKKRSYLESERVGSGILTTYRDDFSKYGRRVNNRRLEKVFSKIPTLVGNKFMYTQIDRQEKSRDIKNALHRLECARIVYRVLHSDANGLPLGAEANDRHFKVVFLDVGLVCRACGLTMADIQAADDLMMVNSGAICEQFVAQHLLYSGRYYEQPQLFCWLRQRGSSNAEVDYLISLGTSIIPVEVKAGKSGRLKSLHIFLNEKGRDFAVRFGISTPTLDDATTSVAGTRPRKFRLLSLPFYLIGQATRLCRENLR